MSFENFIQAFNEVKNRGKFFAMVTLVGVRGSAPQDLGARMLANESGLLFGTAGGGKVEAKCLALIKECYLEKKFNSMQVKWNLQNDVGMTCGGEVQYLFEFFNHERSLAITLFGAGHVAQELAPLLAKISSRVDIYDSRIEWLEKFPANPKLFPHHESDLPSVVANIKSASFVILMTMGHSTDFPILKEILKRDDFPYVGVIGSQAKRMLMERELTHLGYSKSKCESFICPIGLDIGSNDPFEIAVSVMGQIIHKRDLLNAQQV